MIWLNIGLSWKITKIRTTPLFFDIDLCSATSIESSRRDLLNDMTEHRPILKNNQNTYYNVWIVRFLNWNMRIVFGNAFGWCRFTPLSNKRRTAKCVEFHLWSLRGVDRALSLYITYKLNHLKRPLWSSFSLKNGFQRTNKMVYSHHFKSAT